MAVNSCNTRNERMCVRGAFISGVVYPCKNRGRRAVIRSTLDRAFCDSSGLMSSGLTENGLRLGGEGSDIANGFSFRQAFLARQNILARTSVINAHALSKSVALNADYTGTRSQSYIRTGVVQRLYIVRIGGLQHHQNREKLIYCASPIQSKMACISAERVASPRSSKNSSEGELQRQHSSIPLFSLL